MSTKVKTKAKPAAVKRAAAPQPAAVAFDYAAMAQAVVSAMPPAAAPIVRAPRGAFAVAAVGAFAGALLVGYIARAPQPAAVAQPVTVAAATVDYSKITEAVKAGLPVPAKPEVKTVVKTVVKRAAPRVAYYVPAYSGCLCGL